MSSFPQPRALLKTAADRVLYTAKETAKLLRCSTKTLMAIVKSGALRYVQIGNGTKKVRRMFLAADIAAFIENQTRRETPSCLSISRKVRRTTTMTSNGEAIAFTELREKRHAEKQKR